MTVGELLDELARYPREALLVFEDVAEDDGSYEAVEVEFNQDSEVIVRVL